MKEFYDWQSYLNEEERIIVFKDEFYEHCKLNTIIPVSFKLPQKPQSLSSLLAMHQQPSAAGLHV